MKPPAESDRIPREAAFPALKHAIIEATGLSYYADKDAALVAAILRSLDDAPWKSSAAFLAEISQLANGRMDRLAEELTIGETFFFRHTEMFAALREHVFPDLHRRKKEQRILRIWSAGCSIGAEPYSLSILLRTDLAHLFDGWRIEIIGTDINRRFLALAREAAYAPWALRGLSPEMTQRSFTRRGKQWVLHERFRKDVTFQHHNLARDPFPSLVNSLFSLDLIVCRNVMIYFDRPTLVHLAEQFHQTLVPGGWLAVGHAEPSMSLFEAFETINTAGAILYHRRDANSKRVAAPEYSPAALPPAPTVAPLASFPLAAAPRSTPKQRGASGAELIPRSDTLGSGEVGREVRELADRGDVAGAAQACERLLHSHPMDAVLHLLHALLLQHLEEHELASAAARRALYLDRHFALAHYHHGVMLQRGGRARQAQTAWQNALEALGANPDDTPVPHGDGLTAGDLRSLIALQLTSAQRE